ncbi:ATP-binding cassette domain-containing protein [Paenibacillus sp. PDC88]|uniref:ATP-binding cassette domain-containing protein n=1 Tax=Paenibacillus sp. PDC88 TaxID=1884375 RepID=UPI00089A3A64|nr:ATP-binding cassette domain-containing protein [Paenibacillus sp. PDC88]SDW26938.1 ABC transporter [Paenibacillus sp. PDC88]
MSQAKGTIVSTYTAFGLNIQSALPLPELTEAEVTATSNIDVIIHIGDLSLLSHDWNLAQKNFQSKGNQFLFQIPEVGIFHVVEGTRVTVMPYALHDLSRVRLYLLGTCMGVVMLQRKILPLHGSAVVIDGEVYAFVGESGAGKSTLSAALVNRGYNLISDDVIAVSMSSCNPVVYPAYPQQKLNAYSLDMLDMESTSFRIIQDEWKYAVPRKQCFSQDEMTLAGVFELVASGSAEVQLDSVGPFEGINLLQVHTYRLPLVKRLQLLEWHFKEVTQVANRTQLYRLHRPLDQVTIEQLVDTVLQTIDKGVNTPG